MKQQYRIVPIDKFSPDALERMLNVLAADEHVTKITHIQSFKCGHMLMVEGPWPEDEDEASMAAPAAP